MRSGFHYKGGTISVAHYTPVIIGSSNFDSITYAANGTCTPGIDCGYWSSTFRDFKFPLLFSISGVIQSTIDAANSNGVVRQRPALMKSEDYSKYYDPI